MSLFMALNMWARRLHGMRRSFNASGRLRVSLLKLWFELEFLSQVATLITYVWLRLCVLICCLEIMLSITRIGVNWNSSMKRQIKLCLSGRNTLYTSSVVMKFSEVSSMRTPPNFESGGSYTTFFSSATNSNPLYPAMYLHRANERMVKADFLSELFWCRRRDAA